MREKGWYLWNIRRGESSAHPGVLLDIVEAEVTMAQRGSEIRLERPLERLANQGRELALDPLVISGDHGQTSCKRARHSSTKSLSGLAVM